MGLDSVLVQFVKHNLFIVVLKPVLIAVSLGLLARGGEKFG
jgi:hypothetical protein